MCNPPRRSARLASHPTRSPPSPASALKQAPAPVAAAPTASDTRCLPSTSDQQQQQQPKMQLSTLPDTTHQLGIAEAQEQLQQLLLWGGADAVEFGAEESLPAPPAPATAAGDGGGIATATSTAIAAVNALFEGAASDSAGCQQHNQQQHSQQHPSTIISPFAGLTAPAAIPAANILRGTTTTQLAGQQMMILQQQQPQQHMMMPPPAATAVAGPAIAAGGAGGGASTAVPVVLHTSAFAAGDSLALTAPPAQPWQVVPQQQQQFEQPRLRAPSLLPGYQLLPGLRRGSSSSTAPAQQQLPSIFGRCVPATPASSPAAAAHHTPFANVAADNITCFSGCDASTGFSGASAGFMVGPQNPNSSSAPGRAGNNTHPLNVSEAVQAATAVASAAAAAAATCRQQQSGLGGGLGPRAGGVGKSRPLHSSKRQRLLLQSLQEKHEVLLQQANAESALNSLLHKQWTQLSAAYDATTPTATTLLQQQQQQQLNSMCAAAAAAAGGVCGGVDSPGAAAAAAGSAIVSHDAVVAAVHSKWTDKLSQMLDLIPLLEGVPGAAGGGAAGNANISSSSTTTSSDADGSSNRKRGCRQSGGGQQAQQPPLPLPQAGSLASPFEAAAAFMLQQQQASPPFYNPPTHAVSGGGSLGGGGDAAAAAMGDAVGEVAAVTADAGGGGGGGGDAAMTDSDVPVAPGVRDGRGGGPSMGVFGRQQHELTNTRTPHSTSSSGSGSRSPPRSSSDGDADECCPEGCSSRASSPASSLPESPQLQQQQGQEPHRHHQEQHHGTKRHHNALESAAKQLRDEQLSKLLSGSLSLSLSLSQQQPSAPKHARLLLGGGAGGAGAGSSGGGVLFGGSGGAAMPMQLSDSGLRALLSLASGSRQQLLSQSELRALLSSLPSVQQQQQQQQQQAGGIGQQHQQQGQEEDGGGQQRVGAGLADGPTSAAGGGMMITDSDLCFLLHVLSSPGQQQEQEQDKVTVSLQQQQQPQEQRSGGRSSSSGRSSRVLHAPSVSAAAAATAAAAAAATQSAAEVLLESLWRLFEQVAVAGPALLYRCFGPRTAYCPCCCTRRPPATGMMALLLEGESSAGAGVCGCAAGVSAAAGPDTAGAASAPAGASAGPVLAVYASTAHWDRVRDCLQLTPAQTVSLQQLLASLQAAHATCSRQRSQLLQALQQQYMATLGWQGTAAYPSCYMAAGAAAVTDALLADISDSIAGDCGILLEGSSFLWGPQSPLSLLQRVQLLIGSYPFMPDDSLLEHLVAVAAPHNTTTNNGTNAAN